MRSIENSGADLAQERITGGLRSTGSEMDRKFWIALALYAILALLVWFTMDAGKVPVSGRPVDLRLVPLIIIGAMAVRTMVARHAERIRRGADRDSSSEVRRGQV
jgi:hypothetical protein